MPQIGLCMITWNVSGSHLTQNLTPLLGLNTDLPDLYVIGLQEVKPDTDTFFSDSIDDQWSRAIDSSLCSNDYVMVKGLRFGSIRLSVYMKRSQLMVIGKIESQFMSSDVSSRIPVFEYDKRIRSGITIKLTCYNKTICFVNTHSTVYTEYMLEMIEDYEHVLSNMRFRDDKRPNILDQDFVFWMGNLDFDPACFTTEEHKEQRREVNPVSFTDLENLNFYPKYFTYKEQHREPRETITEKGRLFLNFVEGSIQPTPLVSMFDYMIPQCLKRMWRDRILWKIPMEPLQVDQCFYRTDLLLNPGMHQPVVSSFTLSMERLSFPEKKNVVFDVSEKKWHKRKDHTFSYTMSKEFHSSNRDWIGFFPVRFKSLDAFSTSITPATRGYPGNYYRSSFLEENLKDVPVGTYLLLYFSHLDDCVAGQSDKIELVNDDQHEDKDKPEDEDDDDGPDLIIDEDVDDDD